MAMDNSPIDVAIGDTLNIRNENIVPKIVTVEFAGIGIIETTLAIGSSLSLRRTGVGTINFEYHDAPTSGITSL